jgi:hypothetical protein
MQDHIIFAKDKFFSFKLNQVCEQSLLKGGEKK